MLRKFLIIGLPFLAPTIGYILYAYYTRKNREDVAEGKALPPWRTWPWTNLIGGGALFAIIGLMGLAYFGDGGDRESDYAPARLEDGRIVPGGFEDAPKAD